MGGILYDECKCNWRINMLNKFICKLQYKLSLNFMLKQKEERITILMKIVDSKKKATKTKCD